MRPVTTALLALTMITSTLPAAERDTRCFEMRVYFAAEGKLDDLNTRFREHTCKLFEKHGMQNIGYWMPIDNPQRKLVYLLAYPSREAREKSWKAFMADPDWQKASKASEVNGKLVAKAESHFLTPTDYSPEIKPTVMSPDRVFELRTYTASAGNLAALDTRFRDHTIKLFSKHGMQHVGYWHLMPDQKAADITLVYLLAHKSKADADASFAAFRADPNWVSVRKASEDKAGGSLTIPDGVKSEFLKPTDYSQTK